MIFKGLKKELIENKKLHHSLAKGLNYNKLKQLRMNESININ